MKKMALSSPNTAAANWSYENHSRLIKYLLSGIALHGIEKLQGNICRMLCVRTSDTLCFEDFKKSIELVMIFIGIFLFFLHAS